MKKVLDGVRVLDFGRYIAGPFCAALLADFGADVIRIDRIGGSEDRFIMPVTEEGEGAFFLQVNRNKRSLSLDIESPQGREVVRRLIASADVVVANMPPRSLANLGLNYETLRSIRPDIVLSASSAFGSHPDVRDRVGFDGVGQAISGMVHMTGQPDHPMKAMAPVVDFSTGLACALGTVLALYERSSSGNGQEVTSSLLQSSLNLSSGHLIEEAMLGLDRRASVNRSPNYGPSDIFRVSGGWIIVQVLGSAMFKRWTRMIGQPELFDDQRFADDRSRGVHGEALSEAMQAWCDSRTREQALAELEAARIPAGPIQSPRQVLDDDMVKNSGALRWMDYPGASRPVPIVATPVSLSRTPPQVDRRPPLAGEHTMQVLEELGYSQPEVQALRDAGVVGFLYPEDLETQE